MMYRLEQVSGEWLDRGKTLPFTFEGKPYTGYAGDTISSALAAAGVMVLGRSFKYHRPRGILSFANCDVNAMFQLRAVPNVRGDVTPLAAGMQVSAVNTIGGLARDRARWLDRVSRFLPVGFYYKAFNSKRFFPRWERLIRNASGLGRLTLDAPRIFTPKRYSFCDVLVIGGGVSGMSAALAAADAGADVLLVEENARLGGMGHWRPHAAQQGESAEALIARVNGHTRIRTLTNSFAAGCYADHWVSVIEPDRMTKVRAKSVVLASGAIELPQVFRNNDLPGVMLVSAAQRLLHRHAVAAGRNVVVSACGHPGYVAALDLIGHGVRISHVVDSARGSGNEDLIAQLQERNVEVLRDTRVLAAERGSSGCVRSIEIETTDRHRRKVACDALLMSGGWSPALQLLLQAGGRVTFDDALHMHRASDVPAGMFVAGRANGIWRADRKLADGRRAGMQAARHAGKADSESIPAPLAAEPVTFVPIAAHVRGKDFIDFDEDLQMKDLAHAAQEGFDSIELLKRYTTAGMGPSQGKHSNVNAARVLAAIRNESMSVTGLTTARPMYHPVAMKHLAGRGFTPQRATPLEKRHEELHAAWMLAANWRRPEYYRREGQTRAASIAAEVAAVREAVGLIDVSTLGKIEVHGPAAGEFLDRAYAGRYSDLRVGLTRYALLLDEAGTIVDDGVVARVHEQCYYFTTTTSGAPSVYRELLRLNALWGLDCALVNVTGHRAAFNLAGPRSRAVLAKLTDADLADRAFPFLSLREAQVAGVHARLMRVGFVGELGYEIHVPFSAATAVWDALVATGESAGLQPFGVEAQRILRLEKGHFIVGQDTDGLTNPFEAQAGWAVKQLKPFFVGQRSLKILQQRGPRQLLVGFELDRELPELKECHLVLDGADIGGRITSVTYSHTLHKTIGLAMVKPALAQLGTQLRVRLSDGSIVVALVVPTPFYDRDNQRQSLQAAA